MRSSALGVMEGRRLLEAYVPAPTAGTPVAEAAAPPETGTHVASALYLRGLAGYHMGMGRDAEEDLFESATQFALECDTERALAALRAMRAVSVAKRMEGGARFETDMPATCWACQDRPRIVGTR